MPSPGKAELLATPCLPCRENHLKCDRRLMSKCSRCLHSGRECKLAFKFKSAKESFERGQKWLRTPRQLTYVDETPSLTSGSLSQLPAACHQDDSASPTSSRDDILEQRRTTAYGRVSIGEARVEHAASPDQDNDLSARRLPSSSEPSPAAASSLGRLSVDAALSPPHVLRDPNSRGAQPLTPARSTASIPRLPLCEHPLLKDETEARLLRHYVQMIAVCLDLCDPLRNFELLVPQRATECPTLLKAIFAVAARHLSHISEYDPYAANRYHDECLGYLIPMLDNALTVSDENLFAATIILRLLEEMDATSGEDNHGHLLGIHAFVNVGDQIMMPGSLSSASYWIGLRQEIYSAFSTQSPVKMNLDHLIVDRSFEPTDDYTWSNRAVVHLADVLNLCFSEAPISHMRWQYLNEQCIQWERSRPSSFEPIFYRERVAPDAFPQVWYYSSCHVVGVQHHIMAKLFLAQFDPAIPQVGTKRRAAMELVAIQIDQLVRQLCGIGACNQWTPPALFTASMGIAMFGDRFEDRTDQEAMLKVLVETETNHARPTKSVQQQLKRVWGWPAGYGVR